MKENEQKLERNNENSFMLETKFERF